MTWTRNGSWDVIRLLTSISVYSGEERKIDVGYLYSTVKRKDPTFAVGIVYRPLLGLDGRVESGATLSMTNG